MIRYNWATFRRHFGPHLGTPSYFPARVHLYNCEDPVAVWALRKRVWLCHTVILGDSISESDREKWWIALSHGHPWSQYFCVWSGKKSICQSTLIYASPVQVSHNVTTYRLDWDEADSLARDTKGTTQTTNSSDTLALSIAQRRARGR